MSGEESFRFLSRDLFSRLDLKSKALYLVRAQQEIECCKDTLLIQRDEFMEGLTSYPGSTA